jgi:glycosyltransferase involved in cell wall biosynthesis
LAISYALSEASYDVAHVDLQGMAQYCKSLGPLRRVLSLNDAMGLTLFGVAGNRYAPLSMRIAAFVRAWPQMRVDKALFGLADAVHFVGPYDADWCRKRFLVSNAVYLPLAVDDAFLKIERKSDRGNESQKIVIVDKLWAAQHRNAVTNFLSRHWGALHTKFPSAKLIVIGGKGMPPDFQQYAGNLPGVELHEWVDRLEDILAETTIAVFPYSVAVGMKTRVLECMASMNAVVGTPNAFRGLPVEHGEHVFIAENQHGISKGIEELMASNTRRNQMGRCARTVIQNHFTQKSVGEAWECLYEDLIKGRTLKESYA